MFYEFRLDNLLEDLMGFCMTTKGECYVQYVDVGAYVEHHKKSLLGTKLVNRDNISRNKINGYVDYLKKNLPQQYSIIGIDEKRTQIDSYKSEYRERVSVIIKISINPDYAKSLYCDALSFKNRVLQNHSNIVSELVEDILKWHNGFTLSRNCIGDVYHDEVIWFARYNMDNLECKVQCYGLALAIMDEFDKRDIIKNHDYELTFRSPASWGNHGEICVKANINPVIDTRTKW